MANRDRLQNEQGHLLHIFSKSLDALAQAQLVEIQQETLALEITMGEPQQLRGQLSVSNLLKALETKERSLNNQ